MAFFLKHTISFEDINGNGINIRIYKESPTAFTVTTLMGGESPLILENTTNSDNNFYEPIISKVVKIQYLWRGVSDPSLFDFVGTIEDNQYKVEIFYEDGFLTQMFFQGFLLKEESKELWVSNAPHYINLTFSDNLNKQMQISMNYEKHTIGVSSILHSSLSTIFYHFSVLFFEE